jgi:hypothetical protein
LDQLDVGGYASRPCALLRPDRVTRRHLTAPGAIVSTPNGPMCRWTPTAPHIPIYSAGMDLSHGLEALYQHRVRYALFEPTDIAHYPAVHIRRPDEQSTRRCTTSVAVADTALLVFTADDDHLAVPSPLNPCSDADTLATEIMGQLLAGSP